MSGEEKHLPDSWFYTNINGDQWTIYLAEDDDNVIADEEAAAQTDFLAREVYLRRGDLQLNIVRHELFHAYAGYCYLEDTSISIHDAEEVFAALFADRGETILRKADEVFERLCGLRDAK